MTDARGGYRDDETGLAARSRDAEAAWRERLTALHPRALATLAARRGRTRYAQVMVALGGLSLVAVLAPVAVLVSSRAEDEDVIVTGMKVAVVGFFLAAVTPLVALLASRLAARAAGRRVHAALAELAAPHADPIARAARLTEAAPLALARRAVGGGDEASDAGWSLLGHATTFVWLQLVATFAFAAFNLRGLDFLVGSLALSSAVELTVAVVLAGVLRGRIRDGLHRAPGRVGWPWWPAVITAIGLGLPHQLVALMAPIVFAAGLLWAWRRVLARLRREREWLPPEP